MGDYLLALVVATIRNAVNLSTPTSARASFTIDVNSRTMPSLVTLDFPRGPSARAVGLHAALSFPVVVDTEVVAILEFFAGQVMDPDAGLLRVMAQVGTQLGRVVERKRAGDRLVHDAFHDALTGSPNCARLSERLELMSNHSRRSAD